MNLFEEMFGSMVMGQSLFDSDMFESIHRRNMHNFMPRVPPFTMSRGTFGVGSLFDESFDSLFTSGSSMFYRPAQSAFGGGDPFQSMFGGEPFPSLLGGGRRQPPPTNVRMAASSSRGFMFSQLGDTSNANGMRRTERVYADGTREIVTETQNGNIPVTITRRTR